MNIATPPLPEPRQLDLAAGDRPYDVDNPAVLMYYDGPLLFWLPATADTQYLMVALFEMPDCPWPFLAAELTFPQKEDMEEGRLSLRNAVLTAASHWLVKDYFEAGPLTLWPVGEVPEDWLPGDEYLVPRRG